MATLEPSAVIVGVVIADLEVHRDERGIFVETYRREWIAEAREMVQSNRAERAAGSLVGLHYHLRQADYWHVVSGRARVVLHDLRQDSPTEGATLGLDLAADRGLYIPCGVAHGIAAHTDVTLVYLVDGYFDPTDELGVAWDDPDVAADWGISAPILSARDRANPRRADLPAYLRPHAT